MKEYSPRPEGNYELQQTFLEQKQQEINAHFFETGLSLRIFALSQKVGNDYDRADFLDVQFFPAIGKLRGKGQRDDVTMLKVAMKRPTTDGEGATYDYQAIAEIDSTGLFVKRPVHKVSQDDAEGVMAAARDLMQLRSSGELPNLDDSLVFINSYNTTIQKRD